MPFSPLSVSRTGALSASTALPALLLSAFALAQSAPRPVTTQLDTISVTGSRTEKPIGEETGTVTVIGEKELQRRNVHRPQDAVRYEPGVGVSNGSIRAGQGGFNIRGIGENRIRIQTDGVKLPDYPAAGPGYTRDTVDFDSLKRLEVLRGPGSALYGSDALGGVVSYVTKDPADYLGQVGRDWYVGGRANYDSADRSFGKGATAAGRAGPFEALLNYSRRDGRELETKGSLAPNLQDYASDSLLGKLQMGPERNRFRVTGEYLQRKTDTDLLSERGTAHGVTVLSSKGEDLTRRSRLSLDHTYAHPLDFIDRVEWRTYYTRASREEVTWQQRKSARASAFRFSDFDFVQQIFGGEVQAKSSADWFALRHHLTYGAALDKTKTVRVRNRYERNLLSGAVTTRFYGGPGVPDDVYPSKSFPDTQTLQAGAYVQDEIVKGAWHFLPALRVDFYRLTPSPDQAFSNSNSQQFVVRKFSSTALSPKFGLTYQIDPRFALFGQYAHGFRAPPYDDANIGFTNGVMRYEILPNASLKPEKSDGLEAGVRGKFKDGSSFAVSSFYNYYTDFIESHEIGKRQGFTQFQASNVNRATIRGMEARGEYRFLPDWSLNGSLAYARGANRETGKSLNSVPPLTVRAGLGYDDPTDRWGTSLMSTHLARKLQHLGGRNAGEPERFEVPAANFVDLATYWDVMDQVSLNAGIYNLLDKRYYNALDFARDRFNWSERERYIQPGRTFMVGLAAHW